MGGVGTDDLGMHFLQRRELEHSHQTRAGAAMINRSRWVVLLIGLTGACDPVGDRGEKVLGSGLQPLEKSAGEYMISEPVKASEPVSVVPNCNIFTTSSLSRPSWDATAMLGCLDAGDESLNHAEPRMYDTCVPVLWFPIACGRDLPFGAQFCDRGRWTSICRRDDDCAGLGRCFWDSGVGSLPEGLVYGTCERTCMSDADCGRCDMECSTELHTCRVRVRKAFREH